MFNLIVFDLDGTLYDLDDIASLYFSMETEFLKDLFKWDDNKAKNYLVENGIKDHKDDSAKSATDLFISSGIPAEKWTEYRENHFNTDTINKENAISEEIIRKFANKTKIVLLSSNTRKNIEKILMAIGISPNLFYNIYCSDKSPIEGKFSKEKVMKSLLSLNNIKADEMLSVGDRFNTDIIPALNLGGHGIVVRFPKDLIKVFNDLNNNNLHSCEEYKYY